MKILINASNIKVGGGLQVSDSIMRYLSCFIENEYVVVLSPKLHYLTHELNNSKNVTYYKMMGYPNISFQGLKIINELKSIEKVEKPNIVFSIFGPTYWTPKTIHLMGYAIPHYIYKDSPFFKIIDLKFLLKLKLIEFVQSYYIKKNSNYFVTETEDVKNRLSHRFNLNPKQIFTVTNYYHQIFNDFKIKNKYDFLNNHRDKIILTISSYYPHKNLQVIKEVIEELKKRDLKFKFVLTISEKSFVKYFKGYEKFIYNLGPVPIEDCPTLYLYSDIMFLPTLLECFSASYVEAMKMKVPILTSDLSFAKNICQDSAMYFNPLNAIDMASKIEEVLTNQKVYNELSIKGASRLNFFDDHKLRVKKYIQICENLLYVDK